MFLWYGSVELNNHTILTELRLSSDHAPLSINIPIFEETVQSLKLTIPPKSDGELPFIKDIISNFKSLDTSNIDNSEKLKRLINQLGSIVEQSWTKNAKKSRITKHSKQWWMESCSWALDTYRSTRSRENWKFFKSTVKIAKWSFFNDKIQEIANKSQGPWKLINWVKKRKLPPTKAIIHYGRPCLTSESLWSALHSTFNTALHCPINLNILDKIAHKPCHSWNSFSEYEFKLAIDKCTDTSAPGPDKLTWRHWKLIIKDNMCLSKIINIADMCITLSYWPKYFKVSTTVVIPKLNKSSYDSPKAFWPIVLLNTLGKLIKKVIAKRLQFIVVSNNFVHLSQLSGLKFKSTADAGVVLTHIIWSGWTKGRTTSTLAFDIAQFFPSLNHHFLILVLEKAGLNPKVLNFFANYLIQRSMKYLWNNLSSPPFEINVGVGQGSALFPILSMLYISPLLYILENRFKNLNIPISILSFIDDGLFIVQDKSFLSSNSHLFCGYNILSNLLDSFGLVIKHSKTEVFHFSRNHGAFNPPPLDLLLLRGPILWPKNLFKYLGFIFDRKLLFHKHIDHYSNKAISTVKCMKLLGNLSRGINPMQKQLLYRCCTLPIALYGFQLWFYNKAPISYHMKILNKMQRRAVIWILRVFKTSPLEGIEALAGIIPIRFHLHKIANRSQIHPFKLPDNHILKNLLDNSPSQPRLPNSHNISLLTTHQKALTKGHLIDASIKSHGIFPSFSPLDPEFFPGCRIIDNFSNHFSFNLVNKEKDKNHQKTRAQELDEMVLHNSSSSLSAIVITDTSIKNNIATSISHVHSANQPLIKTAHHASFVTTTDAELFAIRCGINQACSLNNVSKIIIVTDSIHAAKKIFDSDVHPFQIHTVAILSKLQKFFNSNESNSIKFWECPSKIKWRFHYDIDKDSKSFSATLSYPSKISWDYCKKSTVMK